MFDSYWDLYVVVNYNGNDVMVVKFKGEFFFYKYDDIDDFFFVFEGEVIMDYEDYDFVIFGVGEIVIVFKGVIYCFCVIEEVKVFLIEFIGEFNIGDSGFMFVFKLYI